MPSTASVLEQAARLIHLRGLHRGEQFMHYGKADLCAFIYLAAEGGKPPQEFFTDEDASLRLIECSAPAMAAIRAVSDALDTEPCTVPVAPGLDVPDYIEHVSNWARTPAIGETNPPSTSEVIGRILRAAQTLEQGLDHVPHQRAA